MKRTGEGGRENEWRLRGKKKKKRVIRELGGELKNHTFQSPHFFFCSIYKEKPSGRKKDYDYL